MNFKQKQIKVILNSFRTNTPVHLNVKGLCNKQCLLCQGNLKIIICPASICFTLALFLTQNSDVNTGKGLLVLGALVSMADVGSTVGHRSKRKDQAGAHGCGREDDCFGLILNNLEDKRTLCVNLQATA